MINKTFGRQIQTVKLSAKESELCEYIAKNSREFIHMAIAEAAEACGVSEATLVRFSKKLGYKGFQALKIQLAQESNVKEYIANDVTEGDSTNDIARKIFSAYIETLDTTLDVVQPEMIDIAAGYIKSARRVIFVGAGGSLAVAMDATNKLMRYGFAVYCYADQNMQRMISSFTTPEDVVFAISHSGATMSTIDALLLAKANGAKTIALTNFSRSPILKYSDITLFTSSKETKYQFESASSRIAQLTILDLILNVIVMSDYKRYSEYLNSTRKSLESAKI